MVDNSFELNPDSMEMQVFNLETIHVFSVIFVKSLTNS